MTTGLALLVALAVLVLTVGCASHHAPAPDPGQGVAQRLTVTSSAFDQNGRIPAVYSALSGNQSPPLQWSGGPAETKSFAIVVDDPDAPAATPFVHWIIYNIPAVVGKLDAGLPAADRLNQPAGAMQGKNSMGTPGYFGPKPPPGTPHHYHIRVYALNSLLQLPPGAERAVLSAAMKGHILAVGELVGTFQSV